MWEETKERICRYDFWLKVRFETATPEQREKGFEKAEQIKQSLSEEEEAEVHEAIRALTVG